jgi:glycosyltransferase involved in cell wall biosynthesis
MCSQKVPNERTDAMKGVPRLSVEDTNKSISCVLALHNEGLIAHKTLKSINRASAFAQRKGLSVQMVITLDRPTSETKDYIERSSVVPPMAKLIPTNFGDLALVRNEGIANSNGEFIAVLDGDDLISENWLVRAYETSQEDPRYIVHPEVSVYFDQKNLLFFHPDMRRADFDETNIVIENYWTSLCFSRRETFLKVPYIATPRFSRFGYEDWHWNCEMMAAGFIHVVASGSAHFIRVKANSSLNAEWGMRNALMRHSTLFEKWAV